MVRTRLALLTCLFVLAACNTPEKPEPEPEVSPPVARTIPHEMSIHGHSRIDDYFWIRDDTRTDPNVIALLEAENAYLDAVMADTTSLQKSLFNEITGRLKDDDSTVPVRNGQYYYHQEYRAGGEYPVYLRKKINGDSDAEIILDENELSKGYDFYNVGNWSVSPSGRVLAFAEDTVSRRQYTLRFRDLETGEYLVDEIPNVSASLAWSSDNRTVFYVTKHPETLLPYRVYRHTLGTAVAEDVLVYEENDDSFYTSVYRSRSGEFIVISLQSTDSSEIRLIPADRPTTDATVLLTREPGHEYRVRHVDDDFYIITNWQALNFRLMRVPENNLGDKSQWRQVLAHREDVLLQDVEVFNRYLVINERQDGLSYLKVLSRDGQSEQVIEFADPTYSARLHSNPEVDTDKVRYVYSSLTTPESVFEYDMNTGDSQLLKRDEVVGTFDSANYVSERIAINARDDTSVPVSLVYHKDFKPDGTNPVYLYAYGSYGYSTNPSFSSLRLSLLDRGFVYAIIHVRGGQEMGRSWYEDGKLLNKRNTFFDFVDATRELVDRKYAAPGKVFAAGGSAGGLLMGVIANEAPELYLGIIAHVPFVDVVTTMLDESIPLTTGEFSEWGNPKDEEYYEYMLSYSPYDQVSEQAYPNMLVTTGLWDSQVQYFEPAKWVSKLRLQKTDDNLLLMRVDMNTGHGGASGRYDRYRIDALEYAFMLKLLGQG